ncbi:hypothetical protein LMG24235_08380 [Paraburkholderia sabiae]|nr:hypothetical protein LMG24235_08380 [Paraburkholderia sabiae]
MIGKANVGVHAQWSRRSGCVRLSFRQPMAAQPAARHRRNREKRKRGLLPDEAHWQVAPWASRPNGDDAQEKENLPRTRKNRAQQLPRLQEISSMVMILGAGDIDRLFFAICRMAVANAYGRKRDCTDERAIGDEHGVVGTMIHLRNASSAWGRSRAEQHERRSGPQRRIRSLLGRRRRCACMATLRARRYDTSATTLADCRERWVGVPRFLGTTFNTFSAAGGDTTKC